MCVLGLKQTWNTTATYEVFMSRTWIATMTIHIVWRRWLERRKTNDNKYRLCPLSCNFTTNQDCQEQHITRHTNNRFINIYYILYIYTLYIFVLSFGVSRVFLHLKPQFPIDSHDSQGVLNNFNFNQTISLRFLPRKLAFLQGQVTKR